MNIMRSEWFKFRKSRAFPIIFIGPLIALLSGLTSSLPFSDNLGINPWYGILFSINLTYSLLFLPLITGVLASLICRYEHQEGAWKQLLALPVTRGKVFITKYVLLMVIVLVIQLLYLGAVYATGIIKGFSTPFPLEIVWKCAFGGWVATFPLVALQFGLSLWFKSFAAPFAVNVIFTLPAILAVQSEKFAPYYPWGQPFSMMYIGGNTNDVFFIPWEQLLTVVGGSFLLFIICGYVYFQRKSI